MCLFLLPFRLFMCLVLRQHDILVDGIELVALGKSQRASSAARREPPWVCRPKGLSTPAQTHPATNGGAMRRCSDCEEPWGPLHLVHRTEGRAVPGVFFRGLYDRSFFYRFRSSFSCFRRRYLLDCLLGWTVFFLQCNYMLVRGGASSEASRDDRLSII